MDTNVLLYFFLAYAAAIIISAAYFKYKIDVLKHQVIDLNSDVKTLRNWALKLGTVAPIKGPDGQIKEFVFVDKQNPADWISKDAEKTADPVEKKSDSNVRTSSDSKFKIRFESVTLPNTKKADRDALRVHFSHPVFDGYPENVEVGSGDVAIFNLSALFSQISGNRDQQLFLKAIWEIGHISRVSEFNPFSCVIYKSGASTWEESEVVVLEAIFEFFRDKYSETEEEE